MRFEVLRQVRPTPADFFFLALRPHAEVLHHGRFRRYPFILHYYCWSLILLYFLLLFATELMESSVQIVYYFRFPGGQGPIVSYYHFELETRSALPVAQIGPVGRLRRFRRMAGWKGLLYILMLVSKWKCGRRIGAITA
jgi:hypothetical protein